MVGFGSGCVTPLTTAGAGGRTSRREDGEGSRGTRVTGGDTRRPGQPVLIIPGKE